MTLSRTSLRIGIHANVAVLACPADGVGFLAADALDAAGRNHHGRVHGREIVLVAGHNLQVRKYVPEYPCAGIDLCINSQKEANADD